jgi:hypothetical protein
MAMHSFPGTSECSNNNYNNYNNNNYYYCCCDRNAHFEVFDNFN